MTDFLDVLYRVGFVDQRGRLDRKQACEFLDVSERTLERWIKTIVFQPISYQLALSVP